MIPEFAEYLLAKPPAYGRWLTVGLVLPLLAAGVGLVLQSFIKPMFIAVTGAAVVSLWALALLMRVLAYRFNHHNADVYEQTAAYVRQIWWRHRRQYVALFDSVLIAPACSTPEQAAELFSRDVQPPASEGAAGIRMPQVFGDDPLAREHQLARLLALQWAEHQGGDPVLTPLHCYWQGSAEAWQAFVDQMSVSCPRVRLPDMPEFWQGMRSLDAIIDRLQNLPPDARILCGGCQSSAFQANSRLPAGEAALLWLMSPSGGVRFYRGERYEVPNDDLSVLAERALQQSRSVIEEKVAVSFSQPEVPDLTSTGWDVETLQQDAYFGELGGLQGMVVQTLTAWRAQRTGAPCLWVASDPHCTLALGVIEADE